MVPATKEKPSRGPGPLSFCWAWVSSGGKAVDVKTYGNYGLRWLLEAMPYPPYPSSVTPQLLSGPGSWSFAGGTNKERM